MEAIRQESLNYNTRISDIEQIRKEVAHLDDRVGLLEQRQDSLEIQVEDVESNQTRHEHLTNTLYSKVEKLENSIKRGCVTNIVIFISLTIVFILICYLILLVTS